MRIWTSYWARAKECPVPIAVSRGIPAGFTGPVAAFLQPPSELLRWWATKKHHFGASTEYAQRYNAEVLTDEPQVVYEKLEKLAGGASECTLICFERSGEFCHRNLIGSYLKSGGYDYAGEYDHKKSS
jgi:hypothetical protein